VKKFLLVALLFVVQPSKTCNQPLSGDSSCKVVQKALLGLLGASYLYFRDDIKTLVDGVVEIKVMGKIHGQKPIDKVQEIVAPHFLNKPGACLFYWKSKIKNKIEEIRKKIEGTRILGKTVERPTFSKTITFCLNDVVAVSCLIGLFALGN
jgi:hypothetical protein